MTEEERLEKNNRIRRKGKETREKRKSQICCVYRVKIDVSHLNLAQKERLKMLFVEAKWLYNDALTFMNDHNINEYDSRIITVHGLDKDRQPVTHDLQFISSQMRQSIIQGIKYSLKALSSLKKKDHKTGKLRYKSDYRSINLQQYRTTYRFYDENHVGIQGFKGRLKIKGTKQFWNIPGIEFANAKLLNLPDGYYLAITTYRDKGGEKRKFKPEIGIDMGIKTTITTSDGKKIKVFVEESERIKRCQRLIARRKKGSSNRYKAVKKLRKAYQKLGSKKRDCANKIVHELLEHERVYMQDENLQGWQKGLFGRIVHHSILGLVKSKLMSSERVTVLPKYEPTTKYCPNCGKLKNDIKLEERVYECTCGYHEDRDVHAARNMILLSKRAIVERSTCGMQGSNAFGEVVDLVELGSPHFYKQG